MFRCAGVVLVLALVFFAQGVAAEPLVDAYGIIQGYVRNENAEVLQGAILTVEVDATTVTDTTDSQGRYTLAIPLHDEDSRTVSVHADCDGYIPYDSTVVVNFGEVTDLDFILSEQAQIIVGAVRDSVFYTGIESVYVSAEGSEISKDTLTNSTGRYWLDGLPAGEYNISFTHPDFLPEYHTINLVIPDPPYVPQTYSLYDTLEQVIWHVDSSLGDDNSGDGRKWSPFASIQTGIDYAGIDDTVLVGPGTYDTEINGGISFGGKQIVVMSDSTFGPELTIVDCNDQNRGFVFENDENWLSVLRGFTIRNGRTAGSGGAILCRRASPTIDGCIVESNYASDRGGGIAVQTETTFPIFSHCVIKYNSARERGGGVYCFEDCNPTFENCTVFGNSADSTNGRGGGITSIMCDATITKCIIWGNSDYYPGEGTDQIDTATSVPIVEYSDVQGGWPGGTGIIDSLPLFCNSNEDNFHLAINSPCNDYPVWGEYIGALGVGCDMLGVICGVVVDSATRDPILAVEVVASDFDGISETRTDLTDINGEYELSIPIIPEAINSADVEFSHPAYKDFTVYDVVFVAGYCTPLDTAMVFGCEYIPGDCNCNESPLELDDVLTMIGYYRGTVSPCFTCACPPHGDYFAATADPNGNCVAYELADVQQMICAYRGTCVAYGCCICPGDGPPPPDPAGACCIDLICEFTSQEQPCLDAGGTWYCGQTCPEFECPTVVAPPAGASAVPSLKSKAKINRSGLAE